MDERPLFIPVILGSIRNNRLSAPVAKVVTDEVAKRPGVRTELVDVAALDIPPEDAGEAIKIPALSETIGFADALIVVAPEYNHGYPGILKRVLDSYLKEYVHKAVGIVGVSTGAFGGARVIQNLLPVMRELGLVTIFYDVNFTRVQDAFDGRGRLRDQAFIPRIEKFLGELVWMATTLRWGRSNVTYS